MTSDKACPCTLQINGAAQADPILGDVTGSSNADKLTWFAYGPYDFKQGENLVRVTFSTGQPLLKELGFVEIGPSNVLVFDGTTSHIEVGDPFDDDSAFTVSLWARTSVQDDGSTHGLIGKQGDPLGKPALWLGPAKGALCYESFSPTGEKFDGAIDGFFGKDRWIHVSWVERGTKYEFHRDGRLLAAVGRNQDGRFQVFVRGADEALWTTAQETPNGLWGRWESLGKGGTLGVTEPAAIADAEGRLVVLVRGKDGSLWSRRQSAPGGAFEDWTRIGGSGGSFAVTANADGRLQVFAVGADSQLQSLRENAPGSGLV